MSWIAVALAAYFLLALVNLLDKFLVDQVIKNSRAYAFIACTMGLAAFAAAPWFLAWPGWPLFGFNLLNGGIFVLAIWLLYEALHRGEASRVLVVVGGLTPIFSLIFSIWFFKEQLAPHEWFGFGLLLSGLLIIIFLPVHRSYLARILHKFNLATAGVGNLSPAILSALAYSLYFISTKQAYASQPFVSAFIWTRLGAALFVLLFLIRRVDRQAIANLWQPTRPGHHKYLIVVNQIAGSLGFILQNYAIFLGSVVLVNALQGVQYAFLLIISTGLALAAPRLLKETFSWRILLQKSAAVAVIAAGLYFIAL